MIEYKKVDLIEDYLSICLPIDSERMECDKLDNETLINICIQLRSLYLLIENKTIIKSPNYIIRKSNEINIQSFFKFESDLIKKLFKEYYLSQNHLCFSFRLKFSNQTDDLTRSNLTLNYYVLKIINKYKIQFRIHFHGDHLPRSIGYYEKIACFDFKKCRNIRAKTMKYKYFFLQKPYDTNCMEYFYSKFKIKNIEKIDSKLSCIQECLKEKFRSSYFVYSKKDEFEFQLTNYDDLNKIDFDSIANCSKLCPNQVCSVIYHNFFRISYIDENYIELHIDKKYKECTSKSKTTEFDFWIQFFGFISLTFGLNFLSFFYKILNKFKNLLSYNDLKNLFDFIEKLTLILLYFIGFYIMNYHFVDYMFNNLIDETIISTSVEPNNLTIALCKELNSTDIEQLTLDQIDKRSFKYDELSQYPVFKFENDEQIVDSNLTIFYYLYKGNLMHKCFSFDLYINELRYRTLLSFTFLVLNVSKFDYIFLTEFRKEFDRSFPSLELNYKLKIIESRQKFNCTNYNYRKDKCFSRSNCIGHCYLRNYLKLHNKLPPDHVIYPKYFNSTFRKQIKFNFVNETANAKILNECELKYLKESCLTIEIKKEDIPLFENPVSIKSINENISLNLYFSKHIRTKRYKLDQLDFTLDLLTVASILIGVNLPLVLSFLIRKLSTFFNEIKFIENYLFIFYIIGFLIHFKIIIDDTFNSELQVDNYSRFNYIESNKYLPNLVFCVNAKNLKLNKNQRLTGYTLDQELKYINFNYLFKEIIYYDLNLNKKTWKPKLDYDQLTNSTIINSNYHTKIDENINLKYFFFLNFKCFELSYKVNYDNFKNNLINNILKIRLNSANVNKLIFNLKQDGTDDYNDYFDLYTNLSYKINVQYNHLSSFDLYQKLSNPLLIFFQNYPINDATQFIRTVKQEFQDTINLTTKRLSLNPDDFKYVIEDKYFDQFNLQYVKRQEKRGLSDFNFKRVSFSSKLYYLDPQFHRQATIYINKLFFFNTIKYRNKTDFYSFFIKLLNCLSFWGNLNLLDLVDLILDRNWLTKYKTLIYNLIHKLKNLLVIFKFRNRIRNSLENVN